MTTSIDKIIEAEQLEKAQHAEKVEASKESLGHYLTGYGKSNPEELKKLLGVFNWQQHARLELETRLTRIMNNLDTDILIAIERGDIRFEEEILKIYSALTASH